MSDDDENGLIESDEDLPPDEDVDALTDPDPDDPPAWDDPLYGATDAEIVQTVRSCGPGSGWRDWGPALDAMVAQKRSKVTGLYVGIFDKRGPVGTECPPVPGSLDPPAEPPMSVEQRLEIVERYLSSRWGDGGRQVRGAGALRYGDIDSSISVIAEMTARHEIRQALHQRKLTVRVASLLQRITNRVHAYAFRQPKHDYPDPPPDPPYGLGSLG